MKWGAKRKRSGASAWRRRVRPRSGTYKRWQRRRGAAGTRTGTMRLRRCTNKIRTVGGDATNTTWDSLFMNPGDNYTYWNLIFNPKDLTGFSDLEAMFDEFRVNKVTYTFMPRFTAAQLNEGTATTPGGTTTSLACPDILTSIDDDGRFLGSTMDGMLQYGNVRFHRGTDRFSVTFTPCAFTSVQIGAVSGTTANVAKYKYKWFAFASGASTGSGNVDFYGLQVGVKLPTGLVAPATSGGTFSTNFYNWDCYVSADISVRKTV